MIKRLFAGLTKMEPQEDGTIKVWGVASAPVVDADGEIITADAMKGAIDNYMKFGAIREMHQPKAAGTALDVSIDDDGKTILCAHIVDPVAVKKVETGVYKGFSIGGKVTGRDEVEKTTITGINWVETSLVDRPANPVAVLTCYKAEGLDGDGGEPLTKAERVELLKAYAGEEVWDATRAMDALRQIQYLLSDEMCEAEKEPPEQIAALQAAIAALKQFIISEIQEDHSPPDATPPAGEIVELKREIEDLKKAGAKFGKDAKDKLGKAHEAIKQASDHLDSLGYKDDEGDDGGDGKGGGDDGKKAAGADDLQKRADDVDSLIKAAFVDCTVDAVQITGMETMKQAFDALTKERKALQKRIQELEAEPAKPKGAVKVISKGEDTGGTSDDQFSKVAPVVDDHGHVNDAASLIKMIHSGAAQPPDR